MRRSVALLGLVLLWGLGARALEAAPLDLVPADPFGTDAYLGKGPGVQWTGEAQLPPLPAAPTVPEGFEGQTWSLPALTNYALSHNPQTAVAWANLRAQAAALGVAESAWLPTVTLTATASRSQRAATQGFIVPARNMANPNLTLSYTLWDFGLRAAKVEGAKAQLFAAAFSQNQAIQLVIFQVAQAYYQLLGNAALLEADRKTLSESRTNLEAAEVLHQAGQATVGDLYQARAALAQAESQVAGQEQTVRSARGALAAASGLPADAPLGIAPLHPVTGPPELKAMVSHLMQAALKANPALQGARAQLASSQASLKEAQATGLPTLGVNSQYGNLYQNGFPPGSNWSVGVTLTVPLFTGFSNQYQIRQARAQVESSRASLANTMQQTELAVWQDYHNFQGAAAAWPGALSGLDNARKALEVVQAQYKVGQATIQDVLQAEATLAQNRATVIQDLVNAYVALAQLSQSVGLPVGEQK